MIIWGLSVNIVFQSRSKSSRSPAKEESIIRKRSSDRKFYSKSPESDSESKRAQKAEQVNRKSSERKEDRKKKLSLFNFSEDESHTFNPYYDKPGSSGSSSQIDLARTITPDRFQRSPLSKIIDPFKSMSQEREIPRVDPPRSPARQEPKSNRSRSFSLGELDDLDLPDIISSPAQLSDVSSEKSDQDFGHDPLRGSNQTRESSQSRSRGSHHSEFDNSPRQPRFSEQTSRYQSKLLS